MLLVFDVYFDLDKCQVVSVLLSHLCLMLKYLLSHLNWLIRKDFPVPPAPVINTLLFLASASSTDRYSCDLSVN